MNSMKSFIQIALFLSGISMHCSAAATSSSSTLHKLNLKNCNATKCLEMTADKAQSSQFNPLFSLSNIVVTVHQKSNNKINRIRGQSGYVDFNQDIIVITQADNSDYLINLKDLSEKDYSK